MEDKHRHIDTAFTDHAWAEMRQLLDDEMPVVEKKRRRFAWWWMWAAFGILAGATAFYFLQTDEKQEPKTADMPVATLEKEVEKEESALNPSTKDFNEKAPLENKNIAALNSSSYVKSGDKISKSQTLKTTQKTDNQPITPQENTLPLTTTETIESTLAVLPLSQPNQPKTEKPKTPSLTSEELKMLSGLDAVPLEKFTTSSSPSLAIATEPFKPRKFGISAYATGFGSPQNSGGGLGAGLLVDFPIKKSRFSIETGVGYAAIFQPLDVVLLTETDETGIYDPGTSGGEELTFADGYVTFSNSVDLSSEQSSTLRAVVQNSNDRLDLHYLQVPLELNYQSGRFRALAGANAGLLLFSNSEVASGGIFSSNKNEAAFNVDTTTNSGTLSSASALDDKIKSFDFAAVGGIGFDFSPKVGFDLRYRLGLVDLVEDNYGNKDYNRFLQATLRYRFK